MSDIRKLTSEEFPSELLEIPQPPKELYIRGTMPDESFIRLAVVGSRKHTTYGKEACQKLIAGLKGYPICIVSGLALGIDSIAHKAALDAGLPTIAIPGSGLDDKVLYPASNQGLARTILNSDGCLLSEFKPEFRATVWTFPQRNRVVAGISKAVLIIEAPEKSGALITSRMATDYNRDVFVVPGSIFSDASKGTNMLLRLGATPIRSSEDILEALGFSPKEKDVNEAEQSLRNCSADELAILSLLSEPIPRDNLIRKSGMPITQLSALLSVMEIKGLIREFMGEIHKN